MLTAAQYRQAAQQARIARDSLDRAEDTFRRSRDGHGVLGANSLAETIDGGLNRCRSQASDLGNRLDDLARQCDWRAAQCDQYTAALNSAKAARASWLDRERRVAAEEGRIANEAAAPPIPRPPHDWIQV